MHHGFVGGSNTKDNAMVTNTWTIEVSWFQQKYRASGQCLSQRGSCQHLYETLLLEIMVRIFLIGHKPVLNKRRLCRRLVVFGHRT